MSFTIKNSLFRNSRWLLESRTRHLKKMEVLPLYKKEQIKRYKKAGLNPSMIYLLDTANGKRIPTEKWNSVKESKLGNLEGLLPFLQIQKLWK